MSKLFKPLTYHTGLCLGAVIYQCPASASIELPTDVSMRLVSYSVHAGIAASFGMKMLIEEVVMDLFVPMCEGC